MLEIPWVSGELDSSLRLRATGGTRISAWKRGREKSEARNSAVAISITGVIDEWITDQYSHQAPFWSYCSSSAHQARLAQEKWVLCALLYGAWWLLWDCQSWWAHEGCAFRPYWSGKMPQVWHCIGTSAVSVCASGGMEVTSFPLVPWWQSIFTAPLLVQWCCWTT